MKLPGYRRIMTEDYSQEQKELIEKLASTLNISFENIYSALNNKLTFADNYAAIIKEVEISVNADGTPKQNLTIPVTYEGRTLSVMVGSVQNLTSQNSYPVSAPFVTFIQSGKNVIIQHFTGLQANNTYRVKLIILKE